MSASIFKKRFGTMTLKRLVVIILSCLSAFYTPLMISAFISNQMTDTKNYSAIMISNYAIYGNDYWAPPLAFIGSYPAWTFYFNSRGQRTDYFLGATMQDFIKVLKDDRCQSIVVVGHGSFNSWEAADGNISNFDIMSLKGQFKKKHGEWFQLTCPARDFSSKQLGELVMADGRSYYYNDQKANTYDFVLDALTAFWHIKSQTLEREHKKAVLKGNQK